MNDNGRELMIGGGTSGRVGGDIRDSEERLLTVLTRALGLPVALQGVTVSP
jgi:hypothetical protein